MELRKNTEACLVDMCDMLEDFTEYNPSSTLAIILGFPEVIIRRNTTNQDLHRFAEIIDSKKDLFPNDDFYVPVGTLAYLRDVKEKLK